MPPKKQKEYFKIKSTLSIDWGILMVAKYPIIFLAHARLGGKSSSLDLSISDTLLRQDSRIT